MKKLRFTFLILTILISLALSGCGTKGKDSYDAGVKLFEEQKYAGAISNFKKTVEENPDFGEAYMYMGRAYNLLQQYDLSIESYQKALGIFKQGKFNAGVANLNDDAKIKQITEVWMPYSQIQEKIQKGIPLTDIEIQKQEEIIKRLNPK
ncbi:MAG: tetratricopeptide repeat protein [bacterium]